MISAMILATSGPLLSELRSLLEQETPPEVRRKLQACLDKVGGFVWERFLVLSALRTHLHGL